MKYRIKQIDDRYYPQVKIWFWMPWIYLAHSCEDHWKKVHASFQQPDHSYPTLERAKEIFALWKEEVIEETRKPKVTYHDL